MATDAEITHFHAPLYIAALPDPAPGLVVIGGGGYNLCCRALAYNRAAGRDPPEHWFTTLRDAPREGAVRDDIKRLADLALMER